MGAELRSYPRFVFVECRDCGRRNAMTHHRHRCARCRAAIRVPTPEDPYVDASLSPVSSKLDGLHEWIIEGF